MIGGLSSGGRGSQMSVDEAVGRLERFKDAMSGANMLPALYAGGLLIQNRWKELIVERFFETGTYARSVHMEDGEVRGDYAEVLLGTDIVDPPYPFYGEFGTQFMAARPTARPAMDEEGEHAFNEFVRVMDILAEGILE